MNSSLPVIAGIVSTILFAGSTLPMLRKAAATRNLRSYSLGNIGLANVGNVVHSIYVFSLPVGPIWALHAFYLVSTGLMLFWYLRYNRPRRAPKPTPLAAPSSSGMPWTGLPATGRWRRLATGRG